jgi:hypothetical protein
MKLLALLTLSIIILGCKHNSDDFKKYFVYAPTKNTDSLLVYKSWYGQIEKSSTKLDNKQNIITYKYDSLNQLMAYNTKKLSGENLKLIESKNLGKIPHIKTILKNNYLTLNKDSIAILTTNQKVNGIEINKKINTKFIGNYTPFKFNGQSHNTIKFEYSRTIKLSAYSLPTRTRNESGFYIFGKNIGLIKHGIIHENDTVLKILTGTSN